MSIKQRSVTRYLFREQLQLLLQTFGFLLASFIVLPLLFAILTGNLSNFSLHDSVTELGLGVAFGFFIFITMTLTYDNFKLFIQNGISRKTYWQAKIVSMMILSFFMEIVSTLYNFLVTAPARGISGARFLDSMPYSLYSHFFGAQLFVNVLGSMFFTWIFFIMLGLTGMAVGSIFGLLTKAIRNIVIVAIPVLGFFGIVFISNSAAGKTTYNFDGLFNFIKFLAGDNGRHTGYFNPAMPILTMLIFAIIMGAIAYFFNQKLKLKK